MNGPFYGDPRWHDGWWWLHGAIPIVLFLVLVGVAVWAVIRLTRERPGMGWVHTSPAGDPALEQARLRYARGDIDREQFLGIERDLTGLGASRPVAPPSTPPAAAPRPPAQTPEPPDPAA